MTEPVSFFGRIGLAFSAFFRVLFQGAFAAKVKALEAGPATAGAASTLSATPVPAPAPPGPAGLNDEQRGALHLLAMLQREGRLVDFLEEDVSGYSDAEIGGAARVVHDGCKKALSSWLGLEPVLPQPDGASVQVPVGFDASALRLTGNVVGQPPFRGSLKHHGWRAKAVSIPAPPRGVDARILAPAEVELP